MKSKNFTTGIKQEITHLPQRDTRPNFVDDIQKNAYMFLVTNTGQVHCGEIAMFIFLGHQAGTSYNEGQAGGKKIRVRPLLTTCCYSYGPRSILRCDISVLIWVHC